MLLARYAPIGSKRYEKLAQVAKSIDKIVEWIPAQLFGIWTIFVAGMASGKAQSDRFYFWDWSDWKIGFVLIVSISLILFILSKKLKYFPYQDNDISFKSRGYHIFMPMIIFYIGLFVFGNLSIQIASTYILPYFAIYLIHTVKINKLKSDILSISNKNIKAIVSIVLLAIAGTIGFLMNDPIISTASIVSLPFLVVLLFGKHVRHLERAKFYPIFIFAMFVVSREAWFLIPLLLLFIILRSYNYLSYQRIYPTFGVTYDRS